MEEPTIGIGARARAGAEDFEAAIVTTVVVDGGGSTPLSRSPTKTLIFKA
jgi:hypothetical protein